MKRWKMASAAILTLCFVFLSPRMAPDSIEELRLESGGPFEEGILFRSKGKAGRALDFDIRDDIKRGHQLLRNKIAGCSFVKEQRKVAFVDKRGRRGERLVSERVMKPNFLLAVEDLKERKISAVRISSEGFVTKGFEVIKLRENGVGSWFEVVYPENMAVLALRTTVRSGKNSFREVVYTPYSPEIDTWQVRKAGLEYLMRQIELAHRDLQARKVKLAAFDGFVADVMATEVSLVLSIIEHIDPARFQNCREGEEIALVHEVLTIIGANTTNAYAYSKSPAGARGLFQLLPDTYRRLQEKYPRAGLTKDFVLGCSDHMNAAKASLLLFDSDLADLPRERLPAVRKNVRTIGRYLAAAYNCGSKRVGKSAKKCGAKWTCRLPDETKIYLKKFDVVWDLRKTLDH
jgi:hypothetical protein